MRQVKTRAQQPLLAPKGKTLRAAAPPAPAEGDGPGAAPEPVYGPAKLRVDVLHHVKVYCTLHHLEMQKFLSDLAEAELQRRGYLLPPAPSAPAADD